MITISNVLRNKNTRCALIPFITAGYPDLESTIEALYTLDQKGADIIELGIPYSDALADGPIIQESSRIALSQGIYIDQILYILKTVKYNLTTPIIVFTYYNPILVKGIKNFIVSIADCGVKGLLIPDLPLEETDYVTKLCIEFGIELILFIAPTSSNTRINNILAKSQGSIYVVSKNGVTGLGNELNNQIQDLVKKIKNIQIDKPIMLGFGISNAEQAQRISKWNVDGIVMGSAFVKVMSNRPSNEAIKSVGSFCAMIKNAINN